MTSYTTNVIDAGARYGMHPTWSEFKGELLYLAFEPDKSECERLARHNTRTDYEIIDCALDNIEGKTVLQITNHRGCSTFSITTISGNRPGIFFN